MNRVHFCIDLCWLNKDLQKVVNNWEFLFKLFLDNWDEGNKFLQAKTQREEISKKKVELMEGFVKELLSRGTVFTEQGILKYYLLP